MSQPGGGPVAKLGPVGSVVLPVGGGQLDKLHRVRLDVDSCKNPDNVSMPVSEAREKGPIQRGMLCTMRSLQKRTGQNMQSEC